VGMATVIRQYDTLPNSENGKVDRCYEMWGRIQLFQYVFNSCFQEIRKYEATINIFSMPFKVNVETVPSRISNGVDKS
jgi:hypothetical protein